MGEPAKEFETGYAEQENALAQAETSAREGRAELDSRYSHFTSLNTLRGSVGLGGDNDPDDVTLLLNHLYALGLIDSDSYWEEKYMADYYRGQLVMTNRSVPASNIPGIIEGIEKWQRSFSQGEVSRLITPASFAELKSTSRQQMSEAENTSGPSDTLDEEAPGAYLVPDGASILVFKSLMSDQVVEEINAPARLLEIRAGTAGLIYVRVQVEGREVSGYVDNNKVQHLLETVVVTANAPEPRNTVMRADGTIYHEEDASGTQIATLKRNDRVFFKRITYPGWAEVELPDGRTGFTQLNNLAMNRPMPDPSARLHHIQPGETLEAIINAYYGSDKDRRFYANVILKFNNPHNDQEGNISIYVEGEETYATRRMVNYDKIVILEGRDIWIPGEDFANSLEGVVSSGSRWELLPGVSGSITQEVVEAVDTYWPVGLGLTLDAGIGLTFGAPSGDLGLGTYFYRKDEDTLMVQKRLDLAAGVEVGVGAGYFMGRNKGEEGRTGVGASASANAGAYGTLYGLLEYHFPFKEDQAVISALATITNTEGSMAMKVASFLDTLGYLQINPADYITKAKVAVGARGEANAGVFAGLRKSGGRNYSETWNQQDRAPGGQASVYDLNPFKPMDFLKSLFGPEFGADAQLALEGRFGVEYGRENHRNPDTGTYEPKKESATFFIEGSALANLNISLPLIPLPTVGLQQGVGVKIKTTIDHTSDNPAWSSPEVSLVAMSGELDYYAGSGSEIEMDGGEAMQAGTEALRNLTLTEDTFKDLVKSTRITKRMALNHALFSAPFERALRGQDRFNALLNREGYQNFGLTVNGYLTLTFDLSNLSDRMITELTRIAEQTINTEGSIFNKATTLLQMIVNGAEQELRGLNNRALNRLVGQLFGPDKIVDGSAYFSIEGGIAGGASAAVGAKLKIDARLTAGVTYEQNILSVVQSFVNNQFVREMLTNTPSEASLDNLMKEVLQQPGGLGDFLESIL
ncbi:hypothetical protein AB9P05_07565 [Roseivirga sp. BDSF3-8]|uniref:hypothetical protein n=1 Tax=Roseivirga sp. BDSF3-8 TaxID=3241598 RepID=UPI00353249AA